MNFSHGGTTGRHMGKWGHQDEKSQLAGGFPLSRPMTPFFVRKKKKDAREMDEGQRKGYSSPKVGI
jgi:hypothetical protein